MIEAIYHQKKFIHRSKITASDLIPQGVLGLKALMLKFQDLVLHHYDEKALIWSEMMKTGKVWVLSKIELDILRLPKVDEVVDLATFSLGVVDKVKGIRELELTTKDGKEMLLKGQTQWMHIDFYQKCLSPFPVDDYPHFEHMTPSEGNFHGKEFVADWRLKELDMNNSVREVSASLRLSDFDIYGHLNNTTYFDLLQNHIFQYHQCKTPKNIKAVYAKEVPLKTKELIIREEKIEDNLVKINFYQKGKEKEEKVFLADVIF